MSLKDDLIAAKALIDTPEKWIRGAFRNAHGYCLLGAVREVAARKAPEACWYDSKMLDALWAHIPGPYANPVGFNDRPNTTHADIMALFDRAIEAAP